MLKTGNYEQIINKEIGAQLDADINKLSKTTPIDELRSFTQNGGKQEPRVDIVVKDVFADNENISPTQRIRY